MVAQVIVKMVNEDFLGEFYFAKDALSLARELTKEGRYRNAAEYYTPAEGEEAAEQAFDISNNPSRVKANVFAFSNVNVLCLSVILLS